MESLETRLTRLEEEFLVSGGKVVPYRIKDLFEYGRGKESAPKQVENWDYPMINETSENNGLTKYAKPTKVLKGNSISVSVNFAQTVFYQPKDFCASVNVMSLYNEKFNQLSYMYVIAQLRKKHAYFNYWGKISKDRLLEETIYLPTLANWELAYDYMEEYIKEIEAYHIKEIEAYLKATGLSDYNLTKDEVESLKTISMGGGRKFRLDELFDIRPSKKIFHWINITIENEKTEHSYPYVVRTSINNWIKGYISEDEEFLNPGKTITFAQDTFFAFYQKEPYYTGNKVKVFYLKWYDMNEKLGEYFTTLINFRIKDLSWWTGSNVKSISNLEITLPVDSDNQIDYPLIETYIKATQKLVIKDLVDKVNKKLETYKNII